MDRDQNQNYYKDRKTDENPDARNAAGSKDDRAPGAGITNRSDEEERENQERLPPRGEQKPGEPPSQTLRRPG